MAKGRGINLKGSTFICRNEKNIFIDGAKSFSEISIHQNVSFQSLRCGKKLKGLDFNQRDRFFAQFQK